MNAPQTPSVSRAVAELAKRIDRKVSTDAAADLIYNLRNAVLTEVEQKLLALVPTSDVPLGISYAANAVREMRQGGGPMTAPQTPGREQEIRARAEAAMYIAPAPSCTRCYGADAARFVAQGGFEIPCPVCVASEVEQLRARVAELEADRDAFRDQRNAVFATNEHLLAQVQESDGARLRAENEARTMFRADRDAAVAAAVRRVEAEANLSLLAETTKLRGLLTAENSRANAAIEREEAAEEAAEEACADRDAAVRRAMAGALPVSEATYGSATFRFGPADDEEAARADTTVASSAREQGEIDTALLATINEVRALNAPLIEALNTVYTSMTVSSPDEWAMEWMGDVWSTLPLNVRAAAGDQDAAQELAAEATR